MIRKNIFYQTYIENRIGRRLSYENNKIIVI